MTASANEVALRAALAYARAGFRSEPMWRIRTKSVPCRRGFLSLASSDPCAVEAAFRAVPGARNVGLVLGECAAGHVFILDIDVGHEDGADGRASARALFEEIGGRPEGPVSRTPRGGWHIWLTAPAGADIPNLSGARALRPGIDVLSRGSIVPVAPSARSDGAYVWIVDMRGAPPPAAPSALLDLIALSARRAAPQRAPDYTARNRGDGDPWALQELERAARSLTGQKKPGRSLRLFHYAAWLGGFVAAGRLGEGDVRGVLFEASRTNGLIMDNGEADIARTISRGLARGFAEPRSRSGGIDRGVQR